MEKSKGQVALKVGLNTLSGKAADKAVGGLLLMSFKIHGSVLLREGLTM